MTLEFQHFGDVSLQATYGMNPPVAGPRRATQPAAPSSLLWNEGSATVGVIEGA